MRRIAPIAGEKVASRALGQNASVETAPGRFHGGGTDPRKQVPAPHARLDGREEASLRRDGVDSMSDVVMLRLLFGPLAPASARDLVGNRWHESLPLIAPP